jgi:hypothetical protein
MLGHDARLMPAKYVRPYSKGQKNDFRDAEAIAEAVQRPTMKFVATKTAEQLDCRRCTGCVSGWSVSAPASLRHHHEADDSEAMLGHWLERQRREPYGQRNKDAKNLPDNDKTRVRIFKQRLSGR